jgi:hypothetical protein
LALYRPDTALDQPFSLRVEMPAGEAVLVAGRLAAAEWSARDPDRDWLPEGEADMRIVFDEWTVDRPCCDARIGDVTATFTLLDGSATAPDLGEPPETDSGSTSTTTPTSTATGPPTVVAYEDQREEPLTSPRGRPPIFRVPERLSTAVLRMEVEVTITVDDTERVVPGELEMTVELP